MHSYICSHSSDSCLLINQLHASVISLSISKGMASVVDKIISHLLSHLLIFCYKYYLRENYSEARAVTQRGLGLENVRA